MKFIHINDNNMKFLRSRDYNYNFNGINGYFIRWGKNLEDNPKFSPFGPEILDIEISTICYMGFPWCYKSNSAMGKNMSFKTFKVIIDKVPRVLTQIAFGIGEIDANPDLRKIMLYTRKKGYVPNITINGRNLTDDWAEFLANTCGAVVVSRYNEDGCFNAVNALTSHGLEQVNIHILLSKETLESCYDLINQSKTDIRLRKLRIIEFLSLKRKGRGFHFHSISQKEFSDLANYALNQNVPIGFDSCSTPKFLSAIRTNKKKDLLNMMTEPCESACFSYYINVYGIGYPCSFLEGETGYNGNDLTKINDFLRDVWYNPTFTEFRTDLLKNNRRCLHFKI